MGTMNEEKNMSPAGNQNIPVIGDGEGEIPLAKQPQEKVDMRTMASDIASMQDTGGTMPRAYTPESKPQPPSEKPAEKSSQQPPAPPTQNVPGMTFPDTTPPPTPQKKKGLFGWILGIIIVIGIVAVGYFFVLPMFTETSTTEITETPEMTDNQIVSPSPETPIVTENPLPEGTDVPPIDVAPAVVTTPLPPGQTLEIHTSLLKNTADLVFDIKLASFGLSDMISSIEFQSTSVPVFKEVVFKTNENKPVSFGYITSRLFPSFFTPETVEKFQNDGTVFSYTNKNGTWLGIIAKLKDNTVIGPVQDSMATLQKSPDLKNIFITDPGTQGAWKDGKVANKPTSLVAFSQNGATFSYTWFDRYLLIGTNLEGSNEAARRLGY